MTATIEQTIDNQWTQFEEFSTPRSASPGANTDGKDNTGVVTFHKIDAGTTRIAVQMDFVPDGLKEKLGDMLGVPERRVKGDLERFKELIESRGQENGAWRGEIPRDA